MPHDSTAEYSVVLMDEADASPSRRPLYPLDTREHTESSLKDFASDYASLPEKAQKVAAHKLKLAAGIYGLELPVNFPPIEGEPTDYTGGNTVFIPDLKKWEERRDAMKEKTGEKTASQQVYYIMGRLPVVDLDSLKLASIYFESHACQMNSPERRQYATDFVKIAEAMEQEVPAPLAKFAGYNRNPYFETFMAQRLQKLTNSAFEKRANQNMTKESMSKTLEQIFLEEVKVGASDAKTMVKEAYDFIVANYKRLDPERTCVALQVLDKTAGLSGWVQDPVSTTFAPYTRPALEKTAESKAYVGPGNKTIHPSNIDWERAEIVLSPVAIQGIKDDFSTLGNLEPFVIESILKK